MEQLLLDNISYLEGKCDMYRDILRMAINLMADDQKTKFYEMLKEIDPKARD